MFQVQGELRVHDLQARKFFFDELRCTLHIDRTPEGQLGHAITGVELFQGGKVFLEQDGSTPAFLDVGQHHGLRVIACLDDAAGLPDHGVARADQLAGRPHEAYHVTGGKHYGYRELTDGDDGVRTDMPLHVGERAVDIGYYGLNVNDGRTSRCTIYVKFKAF